MKCLRYILALGSMTAWLWLALHGNADTEFWVYNDEFGNLVAILPFSAFCLAAIACMETSGKRPVVLARLWTPASLCMMVPVLLGIDMSFMPPQVLHYGVSVVAGIGFAVCFLVVGAGIATLSQRNIVMVAGGGMLVATLLVAGMVMIPQNSVVLMYFMLSAAIKLLVGIPAVSSTMSRAALSMRGMIICSCIFWATGFSRSIYYSLFTVTSIWLPDTITDTLLIPGIGCLLSVFCIQLSTRSARGKSLLLLVPVLLVGYTAWPMLHRESLGLSMLTLNFAFTVLDVFSYLALLYTASRLGGPRRQALLAFAGCALLLGLWLGSFSQPLIRTTLSQVVTVNYMFVFLALFLLGTCLAFMQMLEHMGFWGMSHQQKMGASPPEESLTGGADHLSAETCDALLRQMDLTRQQALIASLIAQKRTDAEICDSLNISQSTLKTHVRNILKRLCLHSRYEISWLIVHALREDSTAESPAEDQ